MRRYLRFLFESARRPLSFALEILRYELAAKTHAYGAPPKPENMTTAQIIDELQREVGDDLRLRSLAAELDRRGAGISA